MAPVVPEKRLCYERWIKSGALSTNMKDETTLKRESVTDPAKQDDPGQGAAGYKERLSP
jgi:hypothetical protein